MGAEEFGQGFAGAFEGVDDVHISGGGLGARQGLLRVGDVVLDFLEAIGEVVGVAADLAAVVVGFVLAGAGDGHLDEHGGDRGEDHHGDGGDRVDAVVFVAGTAEEHEELSGVGDDGGHHGGDGGGQDVAVLDVGELVGEDAGDLVVVEDAHDAGGDGDGCVVGVAAGGEGVGLVGVDNADFGHRQAGAVGEVLDEGVELRGFFARDFLGAAPAQDEGVAAPVAVEVHGD